MADQNITREILTRIENTFHIIVDDADVSPTLVDSLDTLAAYITAKQSNAAPSGEQVRRRMRNAE